MIIGSGVSFMFFETWSKFNPDEREMSHDYIVTGDWNGEEVTGTGISEYCNETGLGRLYNFEITVKTQSEEKRVHFGFAFDLNDTPLSNLYTYIGESEHKGETVKVWEYSDNDMDYTVYTGHLCTVKKYILHSSEFDMVGEIVESVR